VIIFAGLAILPSLMVMMTSFTRIVIVLSFVRRALTTQTIPPTIAVIGLALFLTLYTMAPTYTRVNAEAIQPYLADQVPLADAVTKAGECLKEFMLRQSRKGDVALFVEMAKAPAPATPMDIPMHIVVPAFIISEFRTAFEIGCLLFIPFLLIDMVIASVLLSAGMIMLPPVMISLPFKLILFILVDGWGLLAKSLSWDSVDAMLQKEYCKAHGQQFRTLPGQAHAGDGAVVVRAHPDHLPGGRNHGDAASGRHLHPGHDPDDHPQAPGPRHRHADLQRLDAPGDPAVHRGDLRPHPEPRRQLIRDH
jgi:flagellar biosynthesis protein FliP